MSGRSMRERIRRCAQNLVLVLLGCLIALGIVEVGVRVFDPQPPLMYWPDAIFGWVHPANRDFIYPGNTGSIHVHFNSRGLRDVEHSYEKRRGVYRVLVLGDSFTEGVDVELMDTFPKKLEKLLNAGGHQSEVINAGVGGYGSDQEFLFLAREGWKYEPDLVVVAFTIGNDVHDNVVKGYCRETQAGLVCEQQMNGSVKRWALIYLKTFAQRHFQSYFFLRKKSASSYPIRMILSKLGLTEFNDADDMKRGLPVELSILLREDSGDMAQGWQLTTAILRQMYDDAKRHHARFLIVLIPSGLQVERDNLQRALKAYRLTASDVEAEKPNRIMLEFGATHDIFIVDLLPAFRAAASRGERLLEGHWNKACHSLAAVVICRELVRVGIVPGLKGC